jgi:hypothetical protein
MAEWKTRAATLADAAAIASIYNEGIADRIATFETEPRSRGQIAEWFNGRQLVIVAESAETGPAAFAASLSLQLAALLRRHRRVLGLCRSRISPARRRPCRAFRLTR